MSTFTQSEHVGELITALAKAQAEFTPAIKDSDNPFFKSKYADLAANLNAVRPALNHNGIAIIQADSSDLSRGAAIVRTSLHCGEQWLAVEAEAPALDKSGNINVQTIGSAWTYLRRYTLQALCGLASEDDDGNSLSEGVGKVTPASVAKPPQNSSADPEPEHDLPSESGAISHQTAGAPATPPPAQPPATLPAAAQGASQPQVGVLKFIPPNGLTTVIKGVKDIEARPKTEQYPASKAYMIVNFLGQHNGVGFASCFDTKFWPLLKESIGLECHFQIKEADKGGSHFINIVDVLFVDGQPYLDGKLVVEGAK
jgi:hypothetical protein